MLSYIEKIKKSLKESLPGKAAQDQMMPVNSGNGRILPNQSSFKEGSVLILLYQKNDKIYFPLMQRPNYNGVHGGQISLPGGKKEKHDQDFSATATREAEEEIGVKAKDITVLGRLTELYVSASNFRVIPIVGYISSLPLFIPNPYEVEAIIETQLDDLMNKELTKTTLLNVRGYDIEAPYFDIKGHVVWGATAMILSEFKALLNRNESGSYNISH